MEEQPQTFDICIVCALYEEARAVIDEFSRRCHTSFTSEFYGLNHYQYQYTTIQNRKKESLTVMVTWLPKAGPPAMAQEVTFFVEQFRPRFMAMTGICAGDQNSKVHLGDLIVASSAYHYEEGKITQERQHRPATSTYSPSDQVLQYIQGFINWEEPITQMKEQLLERDLQAKERPKTIIASMASGMAVREDAPFQWLQQHYHRKTVALDMEAASFYSALRTFTNALVVKGVSDFADSTKNDTYHNYAARVSAVYLLYFIQDYVTKQTMPRQPRRKLPDREALEPLEQFIQNYKTLRQEIANYIYLKGSKGFNYQSCENRYNQLYADTLSFLTTSFPSNVLDDDEGFAAHVHSKAIVELEQRNSISVSIARWMISPLANFEKLEAKIDACVSTLEAYKQKYFSVSKQPG